MMVTATVRAMRRLISLRREKRTLFERCYVLMRESSIDVDDIYDLRIFACLSEVAEFGSSMS